MTSRARLRSRDQPEGGPTVEKIPLRPTTNGGPDRFTGDVWLDIIASGEPPSRIRAGRAQRLARARARPMAARDRRDRPDSGARRRVGRDPYRRHSPRWARRVALARRSAGP